VKIPASINGQVGQREQILIVGVGNQLMGDEGVGPYVIHNLSRLPMPENVDIIDCGSDILSIISYIDKPKKIIVIDAIRAGGEPGRIYKYHFNELDNIETNTGSAHQLQVVEALRLLKKTCPCLSSCEITVIGIEPKVMKLIADLSKEVRDSIADLTRLVLEEL
jgi:hydrogenase maturation protease